MRTTHSYKGLGREYLEARKGTPGFASFMIASAGLTRVPANHHPMILELGAGSGQQTEFVEKELSVRGISGYKIIACDKSRRLNKSDSSGQLDILSARIARGEITDRVVPAHLDFDGISLPLASNSIDLAYMAHVFHHLTKKQVVLSELSRVVRTGSGFFILGVTIEDLENHPLDKYFPGKYACDAKRYPTREQLREMFHVAGFSYEEPYKIGKDNGKRMDGAFLKSVANTTFDSALMMMKNDNPIAFAEGVEKLKKEIERTEKSGRYRIYYHMNRKVFWGVRK